MGFKTRVLVKSSSSQTEFEAKISMFISASKFYVHLDDRKNELKALMYELQTQQRVSLEKALVGTICMVYEKKALCRGVVTNIEVATYDVHFVDFGFTSTLPLNQIFELPPKFLQQEAFAVPLSLAGISKWQLSDNLNNALHDYLKNKVKISNELKIIAA